MSFERPLRVHRRHDCEESLEGTEEPMRCAPPDPREQLLEAIRCEVQAWLDRAEREQHA